MIQRLFLLPFEDGEPSFRSVQLYVQYVRIGVSSGAEDAN